MEEDGPVNFKALRAKFQEEALMAQSKTSRPTVAEKPKHLPPPGGNCSSMVSAINIVVENKMPVVTRAIFRDGLWASGGKRPISFPPQPRQISPSFHLANGGSTPRHFLKDRHMPLVLPVLPVKDQKMASPTEKEHKAEAEPVKEVSTQARMRKKSLLLPFKSVKPTKVSGESGEEPTYADLTDRPPCELPSLKKHSTEDGVSLKSDQSATEYSLSSPDLPTTPPFSETNADSESRIFSTLERAKQKFSRQQMLITSKPKSVPSPDYTCRDKAFLLLPLNPDSVGAHPPAPPPMCLPHLACISARPFFKLNTSARKTPFDKQLVRNKAEPSSLKTSEPHPPCVPLKMPLPDLRTQGPLPAKPPRPPMVDLSRFHALRVNDASPGRGQTPSEERPSVRPPVPKPTLDAPEFPDLENSDLEKAEDETVDIAAIELEALDIVSTEIKTPAQAELTNVEASKPDLTVCDPAETSRSCIVRDLNLGSPNIIPLDPASFPEPINLSEFPEPPVVEQWSHCEEAAVDSPAAFRFDETDVGPAECQSVPEDLELSSQATSNDDVQTQSSVCQRDRYYEPCENVYEDVEDIKRFLSGQVSSKRKVGLKNPYADSHPLKEDPCLHKQPRNPWACVSGEHAHLAHLQFVFSKEHLSPNAADHKEQRKREKQRLGRERKEQKEREKKENEMKKKFKVTGDEEPMYHAKVMVASKVRKNDLPVKSGDTVSIIRTTNCPKGKWLARDAKHKYGYISVMNVELNIKEMLELGKKAQVAGRGVNLEADTVSIGSRSSSYPVVTSSFTDDSEEWACEDETPSAFNENPCFPQHTPPAPEMSCVHVGAQHTLSDASLEDLHTQTRHEALQKLAFFFQHIKADFDDVPDGGEATPTNTKTSNFLCAVEEPPYPEQEVDFTELELLPPPPLYADNV
ncbi:uncharacterized protein LOC142399318 [Odontesthes bonariensis]|uniref:uncharacterized protein LOC142399318 n=1 Tax=Odontesthes bonariensis TaxID=219752 RepID=UPI003F58C15A